MVGFYSNPNIEQVNKIVEIVWEVRSLFVHGKRNELGSYKGYPIQAIAKREPIGVGQYLREK